MKSVLRVQLDLLVKITEKIFRAQFKGHKRDAKWPLFVNNQQFGWSASITLDNNNRGLISFELVFILFTLARPSSGLTDCISIVISILKILIYLTTLLIFGSLAPLLPSPPYHRWETLPKWLPINCLYLGSD